jgi:hypothetical protein
VSQSDITFREDRGSNYVNIAAASTQAASVTELIDKSRLRVYKPPHSASLSTGSSLLELDMPFNESPAS